MSAGAQSRWYLGGVCVIRMSKPAGIDAHGEAARVPGVS